MVKPSSILLCTLLGIYSCKCYGTDFFVDPLSGSIEGDGSNTSPWSTIQEVFESNLIESSSYSTPYDDRLATVPKNQGAPVKPGDTLILRTGYHGELEIFQYVNESNITIKAQESHRPWVGKISIRASSKWSIRGLVVSSYRPKVYKPRDYLIFVESHQWQGPSSNVVLENLDVFSSPDVKGWSEKDWISKASNGVWIDSRDSSITDSSIYNIRNGIVVWSDHTVVSANMIYNFSRDAIIGLGNNNIFEKNFITNGFKVDDNHDDAFQSWSVKGKPVENTVVRQNLIVTQLNHPNPKLLSNFQGIVGFDGFYEKWLIENNIVYLNHYHGISFYGIRDSKILNNTVVGFDGEIRMKPKIRVSPHKNGERSWGNIVVNNIGAIRVDSLNGKTRNNTSLDKYQAQDVLTKIEMLNFSPKQQSPAIGAADIEDLPELDFFGRERKSRADTGAVSYDSHSGPILPFKRF